MSSVDTAASSAWRSKGIGVRLTSPHYLGMHPAKLENLLQLTLEPGWKQRVKLSTPHEIQRWLKLFQFRTTRSLDHKLEVSLILRNSTYIIGTRLLPCGRLRLGPRGPSHGTVGYQRLQASVVVQLLPSAAAYRTVTRASGQRGTRVPDCSPSGAKSPDGATAFSHFLDRI